MRVLINDAQISLLRLLLFLLLTVILSLTACDDEPVTISTNTTATQNTPTISIAPMTTTSADSTVKNQDEQVVCQVLDLIIPEGQVEGFWNIALAITNTTNNQVSCDIPIKLYRTDDPNNYRTYIISAILNTNETKVVNSEDIYVPHGSYEVEVSGIKKSVEVG